MSDLTKVRDFAKFGVISDPDPCDIPSTAWSMAVNARFRNGKVTRAPVFRSVRTLGDTTPRYLFSYNATSGLDSVYVGYLDGSVSKLTAAAELDQSITAYSPADAEAAWSHTHLADVLYLNREDRVPWSLGAADSEFQALSGGWDSTWRAHVLRTCSGSLVALNVTKGATNYPTMVKTSAFPTSGTVPSSWDHSDPATNASENILAEMEGQIVDGQALGDALCIYGRNETFLMGYVGGIDIFDYRKLPFARGSINVNCSVEVDGRNYVFGVDDIWMHDGVTDASICEGVTRDRIFQSMNASQASKCFVMHDRAEKAIYFCYVSGDAYVKYTSSSVCNRAAVYSLVTKTWTFDDLPLVRGATRATLDSSATYATIVGTYATIGGTYLDQEDGSKKTTLFVGDADAPFSLTSQLYVYDPTEGSNAAFDVDLNATSAMYLERTGIDFDELNADLRGYKTIQTIYPQGRLDPEATAKLQFSFGVSDFMDDDPAYSEYMDYGGEDYRLDFNQAGRFLALRVLWDEYRPVTFIGFDMELSATADV